MSNVKLQASASGTGTVTIAPPVTNSDLTINLPANSGTVPTIASVVNNGVVYTNSTGAITSSSALTFDGTNYLNVTGLRIGGSDTTNTIYQATGALALSTGSTSSIIFNVNLSEGMRLTTTGLGIGTNSPVGKLDVRGASYVDTDYGYFRANNALQRLRIGTDGSNDIYLPGAAPLTISGQAGVAFSTALTERMRLDSSGNLGIGTSSPNYSLTSYKGGAVANYLQVASGATGAGSLNGLLLGVDASGNGVINAQGGGVNLYTYVAGVLRTTIDSSGNLGLGVTPSAWVTLGPALQLGGGGAFISGRSTNPEVYVGTNAHYNGSNYIYKTSNVASLYAQDTGDHKWYRAPSGTAGNAITFAQAMTLDSSGNLLVGTTTSNGKLAVVGSASSTGYNLFLSQGTAYQDVGGYGDASSGNGTWNWQPGTVPGSGVAEFFTRFRSRASGGTTNHNVIVDGNLGVGITSPAQRLDVRGTTSATIRVGSTGNGGSGDEFGNLEFYWADPDAAEVKAKIYAKNVGNVGPGGGGAADLLFATTPAFGSSTERARITSAGYLLVGTTAATGDARLSVNNPDNVSGDFCFVTTLGSNCNNTSSYHYIAVTGAADKFYVYGNGNVVNTNGSYGTLSDVKLKENIVNATPKLADVMRLQVRNFNLKTEPGHKQIGFVAQEFEQVFPAMVDESPDRDEEGNQLETTTKHIKTSVLVPILVKAIQELKAEFDAYKATHP